MKIQENDMNLLLMIGIILLVVYLLFNNNNNECMVNAVGKAGQKSQTYNPQAYQPNIAQQVEDDNFIPLPTEAEYPWSRNTGNYGEADILDDGANGMLGLNFNLCSKNCCSSQYPPSFSLNPSDFVLMSGKEFIPTSYKCSNSWEDAGCLCMTPEQGLFLNRRGGNAFSDV